MRGKVRKLFKICPRFRITPPMRGKVREFGFVNPVIRITPAYAGKSSPVVSAAGVSWDHPRLCGEKTKKIPKQRYFFHQPASFSFSLQYT